MREGPGPEAIVADDGAGDGDEADRARVRILWELGRRAEDGRGGQEARMRRELHGEREELRPLAGGVRPAAPHQEPGE